MNGMASHLVESVSDAVEQVGALGRTAGRKMQDARSGAADVLTESASSVRAAREAVDELAEKTAGRLEQTAAYVKHYDPVGACVTSVTKAIRRHPASFLTGAIAAGFLFGFAVRGNSTSRGTQSCQKD